MAALTLSGIPSSINSYERLLVWAAMALQSASNGTDVNVVQGGGSVPIVQVQVSKTVDGQDRFIVAAYVPVDFDAISSPTVKPWMAAEDLTTATPNTNFLSN